MPTIHHEVTFNAPAARVYGALMNAAEHAEYTGLPAHIGAAEGEAFSLFGGRVVGRHLQLVPDRRIVQAWRGTHWPEGVFTIVRIELHPDGDKTHLVLDHDAVPEDLVALVDGHWKKRYWEALALYLEPW
jgi:activator of HSP90 ATPase